MKQNPRRLASVTGLLLLGLAAGLAWQSGSARPASKERKPLYYQDSMHPWIKSDRPGKCTICDMDLTPIYEGQAGFGGDDVVVISSNQVTVLNVQTEPVKRVALSRSLRVAGALEANETRKTVVSAPARGRIDVLNVEYAGVEVQEGQKLMTMFSPELVQLRKTLLAVRSTSQPGGTNDFSKPLMDAGIYTGDILAPQSGVVLDRNVYCGQYVAEGDRLMTIADASVLWFRFDVYQDQLPWFQVGQCLDVEVSGIPGKAFPAVISFVEPNFNEATRTVKVRADIRNPVVEVNGHKQRLLKYGMYAEGRVRAQVPNVLAVTRSAVLFPGGGAYAYVEKDSGAYERRNVKLGRQGDELWEVLGGIEEGERVVTAGNVLIDAQAQFSHASGAEGLGDKETGAAVAVQPARAEAPKEQERQGVAASMAGQTMPERAGHSEATVSRTSEMAMATPPAAMHVGPATTPVGTNGMSAKALVEHAGARRTQMMRAIMSPGAELQMQRRASIMAELQERAATNVNSVPANQPPADPTAAMVADPGSAIVPSPATAFPSQAHYQQLQYLILEADAISAALAADDLAQFKAHAARLPTVMAPVQNEIAGRLHWDALLEPLAALGKGEPPKDLDQARARFLPFSTGVVAFSKQLKQDLPGFPKLLIFHCPMAPKPGLWMQVQGPLRNPFFGSKMLRCGEEVTS
jgi:multidrug efflux pump subunit AcrA (membrane-fusion protein)